jgi:hypothetical protein
VEAVDNYFKKTANKLANAWNVRLFVMVSADQALIGFYAINAHSVDYHDQRYTGAGFGGDLLVDVLDCGDPHRTARRQALPAPLRDSRADPRTLIHSHRLPPRAGRRR